MASTKFWQFRFSKEKAVVDLWAKVTFSSGTPTITRGKGILSMVKDSTGVFTITLSNAYNALLGVTSSIMCSTASAVPVRQVSSEAVSTLAAPVIVLKTFAADGTSAANPGDTETMFVHITLSNTSVY